MVEQAQVGRGGAPGRKSARFAGVARRGAGRLLVAVSVVLAAPAAGQDAALPTTVVTATRFPTAPETVGSALTVITAEDLAARQAVLVSDVLREVPGLAVNRSGPMGSLTDVRIRGADANHTLVVIDGVKMNDPASTGLFRFEDLRTADVERIEILRGPQATLYGSNTIGGVVSITTKRGRGRPQAEAFGAGGSFRTLDGGVSLGAGDERVDGYVGISGLTTGGSNIASRGGEDDGYWNGTLNANVGLRPFEALELRGTLRWVEAENEYDDFGPDTRDGLLIPTDADLAERRSSVSGRAQAKLATLDGRLEHTLGFSGLSTRSDQLDRGDKTFEFDADRTILDYQANLFLDTTTLVQASHAFTFIAEWQRDDGRSSFAEFEAINNTGLVADWRVTFLDRLTLSAGLRYDVNDQFEDFLSPRITGSYVIPETGTRLRASWGRGVQNPTLVELFGFFANFQGNPDLEPEQSTGWDAGVEQSLLGGRLTISAGVFRNEIEDFVGSELDPATGDFRPVNLEGRTDTQGLELAARARLLRELELRAAYTLTDTDDPDGDQLARRPRHVGSLGLTWSALADRDGRARLRVDLAARYNGSQEDNVFTPAFAQGRRVLDDFWLVDAAASYELLPGLAVVGRVQNLLDQDYEEAFGYRGSGLGAFLGLRGRLAF